MKHSCRNFFLPWRSIVYGGLHGPFEAGALDELTGTRRPLAASPVCDGAGGSLASGDGAGSEALMAESGGSPGTTAGPRGSIALAAAGFTAAALPEDWTSRQASGSVSSTAAASNSCVRLGRRDARTTTK